ELLRVEILGDDGGHRSRLNAPRADGGAGAAHRRFIGGHERWRPGQAGKTRLRITTASQIVIGAAVALIDISLHALRQFHCLVSFRRAASHGLSGAAGSGLPMSTT